MRVRVVVLAVVVGVLLVGCSEPEPEPSPTKPPVAEVVPEPPVSPSPTELTPEQQAERLKKQNIKDATAMLTEYYRVYNELWVNGWQNWYQRISPYVANQEILTEIGEWETYDKQDGSSHRGEFKIRSMDVSEYEEDPTGAGHEKVIITACIDRESAESLGADGNPHPRVSDYQPVLFHSYAVQHQGVGQQWMLIEDLGYGAPCA